MPADLPRARAIFLHAVGQLPPEAWDTHVADACGGDPELERLVGRLLQAHRDAGSFLARPAADMRTIEDPPADEGPGTVIGPYTLLQPIGEGGMGTVFMAEQSHPVQRRVALKIIKPGMNSR